MPRITMLRSTKGSNTGTTVQTFEKGETYTVSDKLADVFVETMKVAEYASRRADTEGKMETGSRENKDAASEEKSNKEKKEGRRS